jgi:DNA-binding transcriptional regulator YiaG
MMFIYKTQAIKWAGTKAELARRLGITRQAVSLWQDRKPIPQRQALKLIKLDPKEFK